MKTIFNVCRLWSVVFSCVFGLLRTANAAAGDGHWDRQFAMPGAANGNIAFRILNDSLYLGGTSVSAGLLATNTPFDIFDGTNWSVLGDVYGSSPSGIAAVEDFCFFRGELYVGGIFIRAGNAPAIGMAKWDGQDWAAVGNFAGVVACMTSDGTNLYVGGSFTNFGGIVTTNIARWDGTNWSDMGGGLGPYTASATSYVSTLVWHDGLLYAGGTFTNSANGAINNLAVWNGSSWSQFAGGVNGNVASVVFSGNNVYVGGQFTTVGGSVAANNVAMWNGTTWSALGSGMKSSSNSRPINDLALFNSELYATGNFTNAGGAAIPYFAKWNGSSWSSLGAFNSSGAHVISNAGSLYVSGGFNLISNSIVANRLARWDGTRWSSVGKPANGTHTFVQALEVANDGLYCGGLFSGIGSVGATRVARFDGTNWNPLGAGVSGTYNNNSPIVRAIRHLDNDVFVGGAFVTAGSVTANNIAGWNGDWYSLGFGVDNPVTALDVSATDVYVGGTFTNAYDSPGAGYLVNHIARWNPSFGWTSLGFGVNNTVNAISVQPNGVYVGGSFTNAFGFSSTIVANRIAFWDGNDWFALGTGTGAGNGLSGTVNAILVDGADVYVGGSFTNAGGVTARGIAKWNGSAWSTLGSGFIATSTASIAALAKIGSSIYAAGLFTNAGGVTTRIVAKWNGSKWSALGSGAGNEIGYGVGRGNALAVDGNNLYVGGIFETVGNYIDAGYICRWNDQIDFTPQAKLVLSRASLSPGAFTFRASAAAKAAYKVEYSSDFQSWTELLNSDTPRLDITNVANAPIRFYRMTEIP